MSRKIKPLTVGEIYVDTCIQSTNDVILRYVKSSDTADYFKRISGDGYLENSKGLIGFRKGMYWYAPDDEIISENKGGVDMLKNLYKLTVKGEINLVRILSFIVGFLVGHVITILFAL